MSKKGKKSKRRGGWWSLFGLSSIAGLLSFALLVPFVWLGGLGVSATVSIFQNLPDFIRPVNAAESSTIYAMQDGKPVEVARFFNENRKSVAYDQISPNMIRAAIDTEDPRFYEHAGVDWVSLFRAVLTNISQGGGGPGGSTITMQYVKNNLLEAAVLSGDPEAIDMQTSRAYALQRKFQEVRLALALEKNYSKQDIIAGYLNLSFFGTNINGIEAASEYYFGTTAKELTVPQAAMLTAMLKGAEDYRPDVEANQDRALNRRNYVIQNMADAGDITQSEADMYKAMPIELNIQKIPVGCEADQTTAFFCDYVVWSIRNSPEFGPTQTDREALLRRGGLDIYTTMDIKMQRVADKATKTWAPPTNENKLGAATVSVQAGTGRVLALTQNRIYDQTDSNTDGHTSVNYSTDKPYGGSSGFQTGSTYKIFTLAEWLTQGHKLLDHVDARVKEWDAQDFSARCGSLVGTWAPKNDTQEPEDLTALDATAKSVNTAFAAMASQLDLCDIRDTAMRFGVHRADGTELLFYPSSILGINEIAPLTMAAAVAGVANKGVFCTPIAIDRVVVRETQMELAVPKSVCSQAVTPEVAAGMTKAMQAVISGGTGAASNTGDGTPLAGKTGTTDSGVHTWMTGFSTSVGTAVWVGNVSGDVSLRKVKLNNKQASTVRHDIWRTVMKTANKNYPGTAFDPPPQEMIDATMLTVPSVTGQVPDTATQNLISAGFNVKVMTTLVGSTQPAGTVAYTRPKASSVLPKGTMLKVYVSTGGFTQVPDVKGKSVTDATKILNDAGFPTVSVPQPSQVQFFKSDPNVAKGDVIGTVPSAGKAVSSLSAILLVISTGP
ncbi:MAG: PASTA domain-containing protein [Microbacteriaceae bacterium]|nr:PASTA domain-containing protein [Microbacteriaceae bacterium]